MDDKDTPTTSAPGSVTVKGTTYLVDQFTTGSVFAVYDWAMERARKEYNPFKETMDAIAGLGVPPEQQTALLLQAQRVKQVGEVPEELITRVLRSREGAAFALWVLTRKYHPDVTLEQLTAYIDESNRIDVYVEIDRASGANAINAAMLRAGFFRPASPDDGTGSLPTAPTQSQQDSTETSLPSKE